MSEIGTHKQQVDQEIFNQHFDETFKNSTKRPGKTVYSFRDGEVLPKAPWSASGFNITDKVIKEEAA